MKNVEFLEAPRAFSFDAVIYLISNGKFPQVDCCALRSSLIVEASELVNYLFGFRDGFINPNNFRNVAYQASLSWQDQCYGFYHKDSDISWVREMFRYFEKTTTKLDSTSLREVPFGRFGKANLISSDPNVYKDLVVAWKKYGSEFIAHPLSWSYQAELSTLSARAGEVVSSLYYSLLQGGKIAVHVKDHSMAKEGYTGTARFFLQYAKSLDLGINGAMFDFNSIVMVEDGWSWDEIWGFEEGDRQYDPDCMILKYDEKYPGGTYRTTYFNPPEQMFSDLGKLKKRIGNPVHPRYVKVW